MAQIMVHVDAQGTITDELRRELAGVLTDVDETTVTLLRGSVVDNAALMGLLHRLRLAGLRIMNVDALPDPDDLVETDRLSPPELVATLDVAGEIDQRLSLLLGEGRVIREFTTSTVLFRLGVDADLSGVLDLIESANLDLLHVRLHPDGQGAT